MNISPLRKWLFKNGFIIRSGDSRIYTHLLLDGGILHIPEKKNEIFLKKFAKDIDMNQKNYICENRTNIFKLMVDVDFIDEYELPHKVIESMVIDIQNSIKTFLNQTLSFYERRVIVCTTEPKDVIINNSNFIKTGIHLIWPNVYVDKAHALILRSAMIQYLTAKSKRPVFNEWESVFDYSVYTSSGLRMIGSRKMAKCKECKGNRNKKESCDVCFGDGRLDEGRIYKPIIILDGNNSVLISDVHNLLEDPYVMLKETSIRTYEEEVNITIKNNYPSWFSQLKYNEHLHVPKKKKSKNRSTNNVNFNLIEQNKQLKIRIKLNSDDERYIELKKFIKNTYDNKCYYSKMKLMSLYLCGKNEDYFVFQTDSTYCQNVSRDHNSNHIYFYINNKILSQKCLSQTLNKKNVLCSEYSSKPINITAKLYHLLFPNLNKKQQENDDMNQAFKEPIIPKKEYNPNRTENILKSLEMFLLGES